MKNWIILFSFFTLAIGVAQTEEEPVVWSHEVIDLGSNEYEINFTGIILDGWHVYSQYTADGGSMPSIFTYEDAGEGYTLLGKTTEGKTYKAFSDIFEVEETFFKEQAEFSQKIVVTDTTLRQVRVELFYQVCKEVCIPKDYVFEISLDGKPVIFEAAAIDEQSKNLTAALNIDLKNKEALTEGGALTLDSSGNLWMIFFLGFLGGLIALLTPCVFPMIPLTVSFFTKKNGEKSRGIGSALLYSFFIVLIYVLLSLPFHIFDSVDSQILNTIATNIWLNIFFFLIFVFFAFSFFGYYELTLPSSWSTKLDNAAGKIGGGLGVFFMALTLAIVSFSCTGPILGGLLGSTALAEGDVATNLSIGMLGFGIALALPFGLFALFPAWLSSLPKSGGWMNTVKVVLGFLELALAFKFLSNADLVANWGIFKREIFLGIWILLFLLMALYLFGLLKFPHETKPKKLPPTRLGLGILTLIFVAYLGMGIFTNKPLKLLSGFPPPDFYSISEKKNDCPLGINCFKDFDEGLAYAKSVNKPILLDFTGWACVNCRKMEENVWSHADIFSILNEDVVLISLYIDDRKELPESEQFKYEYASGRVKTINTVGEKWGTFQSVNFGAASQPYYVLLSPDLEVLNAAIQNTDTATYEAWLKEGLSRYKELAARTAL